MSTSVAIERRKWKKFGLASNGDNSAVINIAEDIFIERLWEIENKITYTKPISKEKWKPRKNHVKEELKSASKGKGKYIPINKRNGGINIITSLKITNFPLDYTEEDIKILFENIVSIRTVKFLIDRRTGKSYKIGFVNLYNEEDTKYALDKMNGYRMNGLILLVELAKY